MVELVAGGSVLVVLGGLSTHHMACARGDGREAVWAWRIALFWLLTLAGCLGLVTVASHGFGAPSPVMAAVTVFAALLMPILAPFAIGAGICSVWLHLTQRPAATESGPGLTPS